MIAQAYITEWSATAPWPDPAQIEQDLILSRFIIEIARHPLLGKDLAFRGGTCLQKLFFHQARRYSEDLDYVRVVPEGGAGQYFNALRELGETIGLRAGKTASAGSMARMFFDAASEAQIGEIRIKVEINMDEGTSLLGIVKKPYSVKSRWWSGEEQIPTYQAEELLGTKFRALYQRDKGRDLFDLWLGLTELTQDYDAIIRVINHYMKEKVFSYRQFVRSIEQKVATRDFNADLRTLVTEIPPNYNQNDALALVTGALAMRLRNAPPPKIA